MLSKHTIRVLYCFSFDSENLLRFNLSLLRVKFAFDVTDCNFVFPTDEPIEENRLPKALNGNVIILIMPLTIHLIAMNKPLKIQYSPNRTIATMTIIISDHNSQRNQVPVSL